MLFLGESVIAGLVGSLFGILFGLLMARGIAAYVGGMLSEQRTQRRPQPDSGQVDDRIDVRIVSRYIRCSATKSDARRRSVSWLGTANPMFSSDDSQTRCHVDHRHLHMTARTQERPQCRYGCRLDHHLQHPLQEDQQTHERRTSVYVRRTPLIGGRVFS